MEEEKKQNLIKVGVYYDGNFFHHINNYYNYYHNKKSRLNFTGLHRLIRYQIAQELNMDLNLVQIVDAHFFRTRLYAYEASQKGNLIYNDRLMDGSLMNEGVTTHYLPLKGTTGLKQEKGLDVWLSLEAIENTYLKKYDVFALIASDSDYVPLVRKIHTIDTQVMLFSWDFEYLNDEGQKVVTKTSQDLLDEVTVSIQMYDLIENRLKKNDPITNNLFTYAVAQKEINKDELPTDLQISFIHSLKNGYGFIKFPPNNLFFHYSTLLNTDFNELQEGDSVEFTLDYNDRGEAIAKNVRLVTDMIELDNIDPSPNMLE